MRLLMEELQLEFQGINAWNLVPLIGFIVEISIKMD